MSRQRRRFTVCIDFDGTIVEHAFPEIGPLKPGVKEAIERIYEKFEVVISSCRASALFRKADAPICIPDQHPADGRDYVHEMHKFLVDNDIPFDRIDRGDEGKVVALAYIDDRGIPFQNNWGEIAERVTAEGRLWP